MELFVKPPSVSPGVTPRCRTEHTHTLALLLKPCDATRGFQRPELTFLLLISKTNGNRDSPVVRVVSSTSSSPLSQRLLLNYGPWFVFFFFFHTVLLLLVVVSLSLSIVEALCDLPFSYRLEKTIYPTRLPFTHNTSLTQYPSSCKPRPGRHMNWSSRIYQSEPALILLMRPLYSPPTTLPPSRQKTTDSYFGLPRLIEPHCVFFLYLQGWGRCACGGAFEDWTFVRRGFMAPNVFWKIKTVV